ncbi:rod shape-determining protein MreC [Enterobacteriaceae endosymbiont of Donacia tomentosa]|uniref:rod shape-determining protein MreC n=1 Tax=Enterobacteriaceae endosymbiont of Donacia tomentosa TaxID=2675787 RepID=UPI0014492C81|nr:rod shape-determining protein MreC [Enterobacteriaceae endosymbiont of Donacia tomentosa]QJC31472.1 rod shape-determining protein MreC [Enterobacteriaceae endosymbiont of Donacia tomentosa]
MKSIFNKKPAFKLKIIIAIILSVIITTTDIYSNYFVKLRYHIDSNISYFYYIINKPYAIYVNFMKKKTSNSILRKRNKYLYNKLLKQNFELYNLKAIQNENHQLKKISRLPIYYNKQKQFAEIIPTFFPIYKDRIFVNKGSRNNISQGTIALNNRGIIGQVIFSNKASSQVLLVCNKNNSIPIQKRNSNIKFILNGVGCNHNLRAEIPKKINIHIGDLLVTSGLDDQYPKNFPVATVTNIVFDTEKNMNIIYAKPLIKIEEIRYLLLLTNPK